MYRSVKDLHRMGGIITSGRYDIAQTGIRLLYPFIVDGPWDFWQDRRREKLVAKLARCHEADRLIDRRQQVGLYRFCGYPHGKSLF